MITPHDLDDLIIHDEHGIWLATFLYTGKLANLDKLANKVLVAFAGRGGSVWTSDPARD